MQTSSTSRPALRSLGRTAAVFAALGVALALLPALAGCAPSAANDPVVALRVGETPVSLSAYQQILALFTASDAMQSSASATAIGWQSPADRVTVNSAKDQTVSFFVSTLALKAQLDKQHLPVTEKDIDVAIAALNTQVANVNEQLKQTPGNARLRQLANAATPDALRWLAEQQAYTTVFAQKGQVPTVNARGILVRTQADADAIVKQLKGGADFAALAKASSLDTQSGAKGGDLGTIYVGQFAPAFDTQVFETQRAARYVVVPFQNAFGVFEILSRGPAPLSAVTDPQTQQQYVSAWITNVVSPHVTVAQYVGK
jgi:parvulin-like peptidyl-prolyl cis-trans isomerase-like protein